MITIQTTREQDQQVQYLARAAGQDIDTYLQIQFSRLLVGLLDAEEHVARPHRERARIAREFAAAPRELQKKVAADLGLIETASGELATAGDTIELV